VPVIDSQKILRQPNKLLAGDDEISACTNVYNYQANLLVDLLIPFQVHQRDGVVVHIIHDIRVNTADL